MNKALFNIVVSCLLLITLSFAHESVNARNLKHDNQIQKLIIVDGPISKLMDGDPLYRTEAAKKARYGFNPNEVLPYLLSTGWTIVDVHLHENAYVDYLFGYVVVEKLQTE